MKLANLQSIKTKIIASFLIVISAMSILIGVIFYINNNLVSRYQEINSNIVYEQALKDAIWLMVENCYNDFKTGDFTNYENSLKTVHDLEKILDTKTTTNKDTYAAYLGVKNSLKVVIEDVATAKSAWEASGGTEGSYDFFADTSSKFAFVKENTTNLILAETQNIANVSQEIQEIQNVTTAITAVLTALVIIFSILYAFGFGKRITDPIISLSETAKKIADGNLGMNVDQKLLLQTDESGILANSFSTMISNLRKNIIDLNQKTEEEKKQKEEVERMNQLMVGREIKMGEMKEIINDLKKRII